MTVQGSLGLLPSALGLLTFESAADANSLTPYGTNPQMPCTTIDQQQASMMLDSLASAMHIADPVSHNSASLRNNQVNSQAPLSASPAPPPPPPFYLCPRYVDREIKQSCPLATFSASNCCCSIASLNQQLDKTTF